MDIILFDLNMPFCLENFTSIKFKLFMDSDSQFHLSASLSISI